MQEQHQQWVLPRVSTLLSLHSAGSLTIQWMHSALLRSHHEVEHVVRAAEFAHLVHTIAAATDVGGVLNTAAYTH